MFTLLCDLQFYLEIPVNSVLETSEISGLFWVGGTKYDEEVGDLVGVNDIHNVVFATDNSHGKLDCPALEQALSGLFATAMVPLCPCIGKVTQATARI
jgi:hypothetical protein